MVHPGNEYTSAIEYPDISAYHFPFAPATSFDWKCGLLKRKTVFTEDGRIRMKEEYVYNSPDDPVHNIMIPAIKVVRKFPDNIYIYKCLFGICYAYRLESPGKKSFLQV